MDTLAREQRVRYMGPNYLEHWEYLVNIMISARARWGSTNLPHDCSHVDIELTYCGFADLGAYVLPDTLFNFNRVYHYEARRSVRLHSGLDVATVLGAYDSHCLEACISLASAIVYATETGARPSRGIIEVKRCTALTERPPSTQRNLLVLFPRGRDFLRPTEGIRGF